MSAILYWLIIKPISLLPYPLLYLLSDFFYVVLYYLVGYRKKVVRDNISKCFPEKSHAEVIQIEKGFYHHFCDLVVESLKNFSISQEQAQARLKHANPELFKTYADAGKSVIICGGHYANWELWAVTVADVLPYKVMAIYKKLSNKFFDQKMRDSRGQFGLGLISTKETGDYIRQHANELNAIVFAFDQSPSNPKKCLWIEFMGRETAALFGMEKYSVQFNLPVIYGQIRKIKRGHYEVRYEVLENEPLNTEYGEITKRAHDLLERDIRNAPEFWLWSHKRWKHKRPDNE